MAKRYHSSLINQSSGHCNLPQEVVNKEIPNHGSVKNEILQDLYTFAEANSKKQGNQLKNITKPSKI